MSICEKCWREAQQRALSSHRSVTECYYEVLAEHDHFDNEPEEHRKEEQ